MSGDRARWWWIIPGATILLLAAGLAAESPPGTPDRAIGLLQGSVFDVPSPNPVVPAGGDPGDDPVLPRAFPGAPPLVPHQISDFLPVSRDENQCVDCHGVAEKVAGEPTPIPDSHYIDLRRAPAERADRIAGARHVCVSCHVPQTSAAPLVPIR
jgi:cytochrome c-type protein NapB